MFKTVLFGKKTCILIGDDVPSVPNDEGETEKYTEIKRQFKVVRYRFTVSWFVALVSLETPHQIDHEVLDGAGHHSGLQSDSHVSQVGEG